MIELPYDTCFGCGGCLNVCPKDAITMTPDKYGFVHPVIDGERCVECHLCEKACTVYHPQVLNMPIDVIAAVVKDKDELQSVASGGLCTELGRLVIRRSGVVYGCSEKDFHTIRHIRVESESDLDLLKKSKYVHSEMGHAFRMARKDLESGREVLFIGTPCQVSGLYGFLRKRYDNLSTVDMVCHGVPSQKMLHSQIEEFRKPEINRFDNGFVQFRWKDSRYGIRYGIRFGVDGKTIREEVEERNAYMAAFSCGISYRENCYSCPFARQERVSDITAADFWGIGSKVVSKFRDIDGVSLVLLNTEKGRRLFDGVKDNFDTEPHTIVEASRVNANLKHPAEKLPQRDRFLSIFEKKGIKAASYACVPLYRKNCSPVYRMMVRNQVIVLLYNFFKKRLKR